MIEKPKCLEPLQPESEPATAMLVEDPGFAMRVSARSFFTARPALGRTQDAKSAKRAFVGVVQILEARWLFEKKPAHIFKRLQHHI